MFHKIKYVEIFVAGFHHVSNCTCNGVALPHSLMLVTWQSLADSHVVYGTAPCAFSCCLERPSADELPLYQKTIPCRSQPVEVQKAHQLGRVPGHSELHIQGKVSTMLGCCRAHCDQRLQYALPCSLLRAAWLGSQPAGLGCQCWGGLNSPASAHELSWMETLLT